jgi:hypothetical protein
LMVLLPFSPLLFTSQEKTRANNNQLSTSILYSQKNQRPLACPKENYRLNSHLSLVLRSS